MKNKIKYIGFYDQNNSIFKRVHALAATNKMDYICEALNEAGYDVNLISPSWFNDSASLAPFKKKSTVILHKKNTLTYVFSYGTKKKWATKLKILASLIWLFYWLVLNVKKEEKILVYHSPWLVLPVLLAKRIKRFHLILEVEEVYSDVSSLHSYFDKLEQEIFKKADSYLFSTELLAKKINANKKQIIIYGNYRTYESFTKPIEDNKIHLVYAGIIDLEKMGAFNAIESALFLPANYVMHIIGFGEEDKLNKRISEINEESECKIYFDGIKIGDEYIEYCQSCHIGLSTQKMDGNYLKTSFPSKILSYLGMGLKVVSCYVDCVAESKIGDKVSYYEQDNPKSIAAAIMNVKICTRNDFKTIIKELDQEFINDLKTILNYV